MCMFQIEIEIAMDELFGMNLGAINDDGLTLLWLEGDEVSVDVEQRKSAFDPYNGHSAVAVVTGAGAGAGAGGSNMNKRMVEFLTRSKPQRDRCFRHMMNERMRRERHKNSFLSLHALLPHGTKNDKNSIMQMAGREIQMMRRYKEELRRRNKDMGFISFKLPNNIICLDSLLDLLNCLNPIGSDIITIQSQFTHQPPQLLVQFKTTGGGDVEKAIRNRLDEVERKFQGDCVEAAWMA